MQHWDGQPPWPAPSAETALAVLLRLRRFSFAFAFLLLFIVVCICSGCSEDDFKDITDRLDASSSEGSSYSPSAGSSPSLPIGTFELREQVSGFQRLPSPELLPEIGLFQLQAIDGTEMHVSASFGGTVAEAQAQAEERLRSNLIKQVKDWSADESSMWWDERLVLAVWEHGGPERWLVAVGVPDADQALLARVREALAQQQAAEREKRRQRQRRLADGHPRVLVLAPRAQSPAADLIGHSDPGRVAKNIGDIARRELEELIRLMDGPQVLSQPSRTVPADGVPTHAQLVRWGTDLEADRILTGTIERMSSQRRQSRAYGVSTDHVEVHAVVRWHLFDLETAEELATRRIDGRGAMATHRYDQASTTAIAEVVVDAMFDEAENFREFLLKVQASGGALR